VPVGGYSPVLLSLSLSYSLPTSLSHSLSSSLPNPSIPSFVSELRQGKENLLRKEGREESRRGLYVNIPLCANKN